MRRLFPPLAILFAACGPNVATDDPPQTCGGEGPVRLLEDASVGFAAYAGERLLAHTSPSFPPDPARARLFAVEACGEDPVLVAELNLTQYPSYGTAGPHALRGEADGVLSWVDTFGQAPSHPLIAEVASCVLPVGDGLVAQNADGAVVFHPDPTRAEAPPTVLVERALTPDTGYLPLYDFSDCSGSPTEGPAVDGDGILVAEQDGPLVRIALPSGEREVLVEGPVGEFAVLDDPRYLLWRGGSDLHPERDCCAIHLLDRDTGISEPIGAGVIRSEVDWKEEWLEVSGLGAIGTEPYTTLRNYVTGQTVRLDEWWNLEAVLSPTDLLLTRLGEDDSSILDVTTGVLHPVDFPPLAWPERTYDDGVVARRVADPGDQLGELLLLRFDSREPQLLATNVPWDWVRTQRGNLLFVERAGEGEPGALVLVDQDGTRREVAPNVSEFVVPHHGTDRERNEVIYFVPEGADRGMWRLVLP